MNAQIDAQGLEIAGRLQTTSISLRGGKLICLIGPNGSGKTSLLHALAGIGRTTGKTLIDGSSLERASLSQRSRLVAYLPASRDIAWPLVARDVIALGTPNKPDRDSQDAIVEELDLAHVLDRRVDRLSTGERSRVLLARALASEARLLLLDEPISNLDPLWQLKLMDYLRALTRRTGQCVVAAVHDLEIARFYADRLIIMNRGKVAGDGDPAELLDGPHIPEVFGVERGGAGWRPVEVRPADPRSSP